MSNNKQSSVEILCQKLANKLGLQAITFYIDHAEEIAEAKAMHKEEMIQFATDYLDSKCYASFNGNVECACSVEEFYEQTYGGNK